MGGGVVSKSIEQYKPLEERGVGKNRKLEDPGKKGRNGEKRGDPSPYSCPS